MSREMTFLAPRSTSISTSRCPTKPVPPVTTQTFGTGGRGFDEAARCSGDDCGANCGAMAAQVARRAKGRAVAAVVRRLVGGRSHTAADLAADKANYLAACNTLANKQKPKNRSSHIT